MHRLWTTVNEEPFLINPPARVRRRHRRRKGTRHNPGGGVLMAVNARRRRRSGRRRRNPIANLNPRRRRSSRRHRRNAPVRVPRTLMGFFSAQFLTEVAFAAAGAVTPSLVTDRLLPMVGFTMLATQPLMRRLVQFLVPTGVLMFAPRAFGRQAGAFAIGAYAVTTVGLVNDFSGGMIGTLGAYEVAAPITGLGRYEFAPPGLGLDQDEAELLYAA